MNAHCVLGIESFRLISPPVALDALPESIDPNVRTAKRNENARAVKIPVLGVETADFKGALEPFPRRHDVIGFGVVVWLALRLCPSLARLNLARDGVNHALQFCGAVFCCAHCLVLP